jgi:hypothetical protein
MADVGPDSTSTSKVEPAAGGGSGDCGGGAVAGGGAAAEAAAAEAAAEVAFLARLFLAGAEGAAPPTDDVMMRSTSSALRPLTLRPLARHTALSSYTFRSLRAVADMAGEPARGSEVRGCQRSVGVRREEATRERERGRTRSIIVDAGLRALAVNGRESTGLLALLFSLSDKIRSERDKDLLSLVSAQRQEGRGGNVGPRCY